MQVENNTDCQKIIAARVAEGHFRKDAPTFGDVTTFNLSDLKTPNEVDGFVGGFPCQARMLDFHAHRFLSLPIRPSCLLRDAAELV